MAGFGLAEVGAIMTSGSITTVATMNLTKQLDWEWRWEKHGCVKFTQPMDQEHPSAAALLQFVY